MNGWARELTGRPRGRFDEAVGGRSARDARGGGAHGLIAAGIVVMVVFFGLIGGWGALSRLESAVVADGAFEAAGNRKALQHREGGIVRTVQAQDGDRVLAGQALITLDDAAARSQVTALSVQWDSLAILRARLVAERDDASSFAPPSDLAELPDPGASARLIATQQALLMERRRQIEGEVSILDGVVTQQQDQEQGLDAQVKGLDAQLASIREETEATRKLLAAGFATRTRVAALDRNLASLEGDRGRVMAQIAGLKGAIGETGLRQAQIRRDRLSELAEQLRQVEQQTEELAPRLAIARDTLERMVMRAPATGVVYGLNVFTVGGVIAAGQKVLEIVPDGGQPDLVVRVPATDAERLEVGQSVDVVLPGVPVSRRPLVSAHLATISADRLTDARSGAPYYEARVKVDTIRQGPGTDGAGSTVRIGPGMPGEAVIETGSRTILQYLVGPMADQIRRAMREE
jgi:HlyD family type I secretion membrane fusion protein